MGAFYGVCGAPGEKMTGLAATVEALHVIHLN
jgi:hypothetical protein